MESSPDKMPAPENSPSPKNPASTDNLFEQFSMVKADQLFASGPYDALYRVRDLEDDVWYLGRYFVNPVDPAKLNELKLDFEKCRLIQHDRVVPTRKMMMEKDHLAIFWEYREGTTLEERLHREFGPRKIVQFILATANSIQDLNEQQMRMEYLSFSDILIDIDDMPILMAGTFSHHLAGKGDTTAFVEDYQQRLLYRLGAVLLSICFGRHYDELIEAAQLETDVIVLMDRFRDLMGVDPSLMAIIAKCLMPIDSKRYGSVADMKTDLEEYLRGRAVTVEGVDFHQMILSWRERKKERDA